MVRVSINSLPCPVKHGRRALAGVAQVIGPSSRQLKDWGLIPGQDTCLGCGFGPCRGTYKRYPNQCFSLTSMFLFLSLKSISMSSAEDKKMEEGNLNIKPTSVKTELEKSLESEVKINHIFGLCWFGQLA